MPSGIRHSCGEVRLNSFTKNADRAAVRTLLWPALVSMLSSKLEKSQIKIGLDQYEAVLQKIRNPFKVRRDRNNFSTSARAILAFGVFEV